MNYDLKRFLIVLFLFVPVIAFAQEANYAVKGRDVLRITVYEHDDLNQLVRVTEDGSITFPLVGEIQVKGLTAQQIEKKIAELLSKGFIVNPQVSVFVQEFRLNQVTVIGEVNKPGQYNLNMNEPTYVADIIADSLGVTLGAGERLIILRKTNAKQENIIIDLQKLLKTGDLSQNIELQKDDILSVPKAGYFYIYGEVQRPGFYKIEPDMTVIRSISRAGGLTTQGDTRGTRIIRKNNDNETTTRVKLNNPIQSSDEFFKEGDMAQDIKLQDGDVVYIPRSARFYVYGEVQNPKAYLLEPGFNLIKAISAAGGPTASANTEAVRVIRKVDGKDTTINIALVNPVNPDESFFKNGDMSQNIEIQDEDIIYIPRVARFYVYGEVNKPGQYYKIDPDLTVIKAISIAGGITDKASTGRIEVKRKKGLEEVTVPAELNALVQGEDVIIVPESFF